MSNVVFTRNLKRVLYRRLPQSNEYEWSRRIEGALVKSEESTSHDSGAVIIDDELSEDQSKKLIESLLDFLSRDAYFKRTKYNAILWKESAFSGISEHGGIITLCSIKKLKADINSVATNGTASGDWENFRKLYNPHKRAGQVFLITTQEKVDLLEQAQAMNIRNLVIIYPHTDEKKRKSLIKNIPCIPFVE